MEFKTPLEVLRDVASSNPSLPFLLSANSHSISYSDAIKRINAIANFLWPYTQQLHSAAPLIIGLHVTAEVDFVLGVYAIWTLGGTAAVFNKVCLCHSLA